jgi:ABC-type glutathione transport system ATPase component
MDSHARAALHGVVDRLRGRGAAVVLATHDGHLVAEVADTVAVLEAGRVSEVSDPETLLSGDRPYSTQVGQLYPGGPVTVAGVLARL